MPRNSRPCLARGEQHQAHRGRQPRAVIHVKSTKPARRSLLESFGQQGERTTLSWMRPASGLTTALDPVMRACGGVWVAHGSGDADRDVVRRARPRRRAARGPALHAAPRLADARKRSRATTTASPTARCGRCATTPTPAGLRPARLGAVPAQVNSNSPTPCWTRSATSRRWSSCRTTTSRCCRGCSRRPGPTWWCAQFWHIPWPNPRGVPRLPVGRRDARRPARQRPAGVPHPVPLQQLPGDGGPRAGVRGSTGSDSR